MPWRAPIGSPASWSLAGLAGLGYRLNSRVLLAAPLLLDAGADAKDPAILALALESTSTELKPFLDRGADPNAIHPSGAGTDLARKDRAGWTVLMAHATGNRGFGPGNGSGIADLLEAGADPAVPAPDGTTLADLFAKAGPYNFHEGRLPAIRKALGR